MPPTYRQIFHKFYTLFDCDVTVCYYCGDDAAEFDHAPPLAYIRDEILRGNYDVLSQYKLSIVPACNACNMKLGSKPLLTLLEREQFIAGTYSPDKLVDFVRWMRKQIAPQKKMGRPRISELETTTISFTVSETTRNELITIAQEQEISVSKVCRDILLEWLAKKDSKYSINLITKRSCTPQRKHVRTKLHNKKTTGAGYIKSLLEKPAKFGEETIKQITRTNPYYAKYKKGN